ncbi:MAG: hypothetical protein Q8N79_03625, partial [Candidatus Methanoperedens sp.]|nr:hypothetical protein [Candidatus Methanoperedens sp.]
TPSLQDWKALYDAAIEFKNAAPWDWMHDTDIFGVQDPVSGETGYCCIMGAAGEHYALGVYSGLEGLEVLFRILSGEFSQSHDEVLYVQKCLMASFEDREYLQKEDLKQIKTMGLKFRGANAWPFFRNYTPGFVPWYLTGEEARFLTLALQQAIEVSLRFRKDPMLIHPSSGKFFVRAPVKQGEGISWKDEWIEPLPPESKDFPAVPVDETLLKRLKKAGLQQRGIWEVDFFFIPAPIWEKEKRPYYPYMSLIVEHNSAFILNFQLEKREEFALKFPEKFISFLERVKIAPQAFLVKRDEVGRFLEPFAAKASIKIKMVESLPVLEEAQRSMRGFI